MLLTDGLMPRNPIIGYRPFLTLSFVSLILAGFRLNGKVKRLIEAWANCPTVSAYWAILFIHSLKKNKNKHEKKEDWLDRYYALHMSNVGLYHRTVESPTVKKRFTLAHMSLWCGFQSAVSWHSSLLQYVANVHQTPLQQGHLCQALTMGAGRKEADNLLDAGGGK